MHRLRDVVLAVGLLALPLLVLRANLRDPDEVGPLDRALLLLSAPVQRGATGAAEAVRTIWTDYVFLIRLRGENERLRRDNARLRALAERAARADARAARYEKLLDLRGETPSETVAARIIARETSPLFRVIRVSLDRGDKEVRAGMPVVAPEGVVGRIGRTYGRYSDVLLILDAKSALDVRILPSGARGIARGLGGEGHGCRLEYVLRDEPVRPGERVVTSGEGGAFPRDLDVGRVTHVSRSEPGLYQEVEIAPAVDFSRLNEALIILAPPPSPDLEALLRRRLPARGLGILR